MNVSSFSTTIGLTTKVMVIKIRLWNKNLLSQFEITQLPNSVRTHPDSSRKQQKNTKTANINTRNKLCHCMSESHPQDFCFYLTIISEVSHVQYSGQKLGNLPVLFICEHKHLHNRQMKKNVHVSEIYRSLSLQVQVKSQGLMVVINFLSFAVSYVGCIEQCLNKGQHLYKKMLSQSLCKKTR